LRSGPAVSALVAMTAALWQQGAAVAQPAVPCGRFTQEALPAAHPRYDDARARAVFEVINAAVKSQPHRVLFLGDSLTEGFNSAVWREHMMPRGVLNAGIGGDATEELRWRLEHGNLDGPPPQAVVLLIGSNDLARGQTPEATAEGIRAILVVLRNRLPNARILLLGLWPREDMPAIVERHEIATVNALITTCADGKKVRYADLGRLLLGTDGKLSRNISPDLVHFNAQGYAQITPALDHLIDELLDEH